MAIPTIIYRIPLVFSDQQMRELNSHLTGEEQSRAARYLIDRPRQQFVGCRVALKFVLAKALHCSPAEVRLELGRWGKPRLQKSSLKSDRSASSTTANPTLNAASSIPRLSSIPESHEFSSATDTLEFSVSHSGEMGLIGLSRLPIGVDIELWKPRISLASLSNMVLSHSESQAWKLLPAQEREQQMLRLWVCKEAYLKAMGLGIAECLQQVSFPIPLHEAGNFSPSWIDPTLQVHLEESPSCTRNSWLQCQSWGIRIISEIENYAAALAVLDSQANYEIQEFDWSMLLDS